MPRNLRQRLFRQPPNTHKAEAFQFVQGYLDNKFVKKSLGIQYDFSTESLLILSMHFLSLFKLIICSTSKILSSDKCGYLITKYHNECFKHNGDIVFFFEVYDRLYRLISYYLSCKSDFSKGLYIKQIKYEFMSLVPTFNALAEYLGSFSNTCVYRNVTINNRVLSIVDRRLNTSHKYLIAMVHKQIAVFFDVYYSIFTTHHNIKHNIYGFIKGKSCVDNAKYHLENKPQAMINTDVNKFFNNCTILKMLSSKVFLDTLNTFNAPSEIINSFHVGIISALFYATHNSVFPTGSIFTPVLSNLIFLNIDVEIISYIDSLKNQYDISELSLRYSRYADDITLSTNIQKINNNNVLNIVVLKDIEKILNKYGFYIKYAKSKISGKGDAKIVNGIVLDIDNNKLSIGSDKKLHLKQLKDANPDILKDSSYAGYMSYLRNVSPEQYDYIMEIKNNDLRGTQITDPW